MVSRRDAILNLASLLNRAPGSPDEVTGEGLLQPDQELLDADGLELRQPLAWSLRVFNAGGDDDFVVEGEVHGTAVLECRRCLTEVPTEAAASFVLPMHYVGDEGGLRLDEFGEDDEERLLFGRPDVDFGPYLAQVFAIELPLTVLCREECKGLSLDGVNLNEHPDHVADAERAHEDDRASPFDALKDFDLTS